MITQDNDMEKEKLSGTSKKLQVCVICGGELSANELFKGGKCYVCEGRPFMNEEGEVRRIVEDDKIGRAWSRELGINV